MRINKKTKREILNLWEGSRFIGNRVILKCGCEFTVKQMVEALEREKAGTVRINPDLFQLKSEYLET